IGTQGARIVVLDSAGTVVAGSAKVFILDEESREEQSPALWWQACLACFKELTETIKGKLDFNDIVAMAVTSTSGTVIPMDSNNLPLHNALMYSDKRSAKQAEKCISIALKYHSSGFTGFNSSSALAKIVWFGETYPDKAAR